MALSGEKSVPIYIAFMRDDATSSPTSVEWEAFFQEAGASGLFRGGSGLGAPILLRRAGEPAPASSIGGFMRFEAESVAQLRPLLERHPWHIHGGTIELRPLSVDGEE